MAYEKCDGTETSSKRQLPLIERPAATLKRNRKMTQRDAVFPAGRHALYEAHGYSAAIRSGDLLFVSGQVGARPDGTPNLISGVRFNWPSIISGRP
jgi:enamine deaminase RidA (YjgF/YER057c/UK114 family)